VVAHFVRPGGFFYIAEAHPFAWVFDDDSRVRRLAAAGARRREAAAAALAQGDEGLA
jgi:hypothetical protein